MTESAALDGAGSPSMEASRLLSITQRWDTGDRALSGSTEAFGVLLAGVCIGGLELLVFMLAVCCKRIKPQHLTVFQLSLTFAVILQSLSSPVVAMDLMGTICQVNHCYTLVAAWLASRRFGTLLHLLVTLEFMVLKTKSHVDTKTLPLFLTLPFVFTLGLICILYYEVIEAVVALGAVAIALCLAIGIYTLRNRTSMDKHSATIVCTAVITVGATYFPSFVLECIILHKGVISYWSWVLCVCLTNLRLITDPALLWMICRLSDEAPEQTEAGNQLHSVPQTPL